MRRVFVRTVVVRQGNHPVLLAVVDCLSVRHRAELASVCVSGARARGANVAVAAVAVVDLAGWGGAVFEPVAAPAE